MSSASDKANLARIRDNQRRSRARRKEYLTELETKLRQCEQLGVEASAEIQLAARRVADENKKLRSLLAQNGIDDDTVDIYLNTPPTTSALPGLQSSTSLQVQVLEQSLQRRKPCCPDGKGDISVMATRAGSHESIPSTTQSSWDAALPYIPMETPMSGSSQATTRSHEPAGQYVMPTNSTTSQSTVYHVPHRDDPHHHRIASFTQHRSSRSQMSDSSSYQSTQLTSQNPRDTYFAPMPTHTIAQDNFQYQNRSQQSPVATSPGNVNSCFYATSMITTMAGGDEAAVRADLGCLPNVDCDVDNQLVFDVMDRYSGDPPL